MEPMKTPAYLGVGTPRTDFVRGDVVRRVSDMGYGISEIREREGEREGGGDDEDGDRPQPLHAGAGLFPKEKERR